jgi:hypothetical protein
MQTNLNKENNYENENDDEMFDFGVPPIETFMNISSKYRREHLINVIINNIFFFIIIIHYAIFKLFIMKID